MFRFQKFSGILFDVHRPFLNVANGFLLAETPWNDEPDQRRHKYAQKTKNHKRRLPTAGLQCDASAPLRPNHAANAEANVDAAQDECLVLVKVASTGNEEPRQLHAFANTRDYPIECHVKDAGGDDRG